MISQFLSCARFGFKPKMIGASKSTKPMRFECDSLADAREKSKTFNVFFKAHERSGLVELKNYVAVKNPSADVAFCEDKYGIRPNWKFTGGYYAFVFPFPVDPASYDTLKESVLYAF